jgi:adenosylcobinamide-GDP ribazoletransferase
VKSFLTALAFLTVLPIRFRVQPSAEDVARSRFWYPVVGLLLGLILGGWMELTKQLGLPMVSAFLVLLAWVGLTGALHLDGLCDFCDGVFGGRNPEDRLRIMKEPHLGTFGLVGGVLVILGKFVALQGIAIDRLAEVVSLRIVGVSVIVARCMVWWVAAGASYPREEGTGKALIEAIRWPEAAVYAAMAAGASWLAVPDLNAITALGLFLPVCIVALIIRWICGRRLGGVTGDCLGASIELTEVVFLLAAVVAFKLATQDP